MIIAVSRPRRRCGGVTVTAVTADAARVAGPGTVSSVAKDASVPTTRSASKAAQVRVRSARRAKTSPSGRALTRKKAESMQARNGSTSSAVIGRTS